MKSQVTDQRYVMFQCGISQLITSEKIKVLDIHWWSKCKLQSLMVEIYVMMDNVIEYHCGQVTTTNICHTECLLKSTLASYIHYDNI